MKRCTLKNKKIKNNGSYSKKEKNTDAKAFSFVNKNIRSSLTIEAAIALPLFVFFVIGITYFLIIISLQTNIQIGMDEAARSIGKKIYLANQIEEIYGNLKTSDNESKDSNKLLTEEVEGNEIDEETKSIVATGINALTIKTWILKGNLFDKISKSQIVGKVTGFRTDKSSYDEEEGILDIVVNYTYTIPFLPQSMANINFVQRSKTHVWTGRQIKLGTDDSKTERKTVYITPTGTVYHTSKTCPFLDLSIQMVQYSELESIRNKNDGKYYRCAECAKSGSPTYVYITDYGTKWHNSSDCTGLKRTIIEKDISEIGDMHLCSKCADSVAEHDVNKEEDNS